VTARFANYVDLDDSQLASSRCHSTFWNYYVTFRHYFGAPRMLRFEADVSFPPLVTPLLLGRRGNSHRRSRTTHGFQWSLRQICRIHKKRGRFANRALLCSQLSFLA